MEDNKSALTTLSRRMRRKLHRWLLSKIRLRESLRLLSQITEYQVLTKGEEMIVNTNRPTSILRLMRDQQEKDQLGKQKIPLKLFKEEKKTREI